jgi:beta-lactamase superfamily II metal-dependent hydrolase
MAKFAGTGDVYLRDLNDRSKKVKQILWGDWLSIDEETNDGWSKVKWGGQRYWIKTSDCQDERPLEVVFVDVGQGDGCLVVTPDLPPAERVMIIDAGIGRNMSNFISWRFGKLKKSFKFHAAVVTHPDKDHYNGFQPIFDQKLFSFDRVYHNGIFERKGVERLGPSDPAGRYLTEIATTHAEARAIYADPNRRGSMPYPRLIWSALTNGRVKSVDMLSATASSGTQSWMPGFAPSDNSELTIEVLGPVLESDAAGTPRLRWFGDQIGSTGKDEGKTKNGHSVLLRLRYREFTLLFGGDLNRPAEDFLLRHYGGIPVSSPLEAAVSGARARLRCDVMKSCHHGSADVTDAFLQAVDPFAFVVSSGDDESHVHPRPDLLGRLGRHGRGQAPLILCTEILRSTRELEDQTQLKRMDQLDALIENPATPATDRTAFRAERAAIRKALARRNVEIYGAITLRTDGKQLVVAFRLEREREGKSPKRWQTYAFRHDAQKGFVPEDGDSR